MLVQEAKALARQWVLTQGSQLPGFGGAFYHGSTNWLADNALLPPTSDLDVMVVLDVAVPTDKLGKFLYQGVMLEVSYLPREQVQSPEQILGNYHLAGSFRQPGILADPSDQLTALQRAVSAAYAQRHWVTRRCEHARDHVLQHLQRGVQATRFADQVTSWLFGAGVTTHILLVAGLRNPTVRQRYGAVRELLTAYGRADVYPQLLALLGCETMSQDQATEHLIALAAAFDVAKVLIKTPFAFAADISEAARPVAIDGSRTLIEQGDQREAIFWMVATYSRCQQVLYQDAPVAVQERFTPGYLRLLADLGINSVADLAVRSDQIRAKLPYLWSVAEAIIDANPEIVDP